MKSAKKRDGFTVEQLNAMFRTPTYTGKKSAYHWKEPGSYLPKDECFWIPLVALFTGGRRREICQLLTADVREIDAIPCIDINEEGTKSTKNAHSIRTIPVHPELKRLGFLDYVEKRRSANKKVLFDADPGNSSNYDPFGKWFSRFLDTLGLDSKRLVFHSFRHTFEQAMLDAQIDFRYACFLGGRTLDHSSSHYVTRPPAQSLLAELSKVSYPGLDLSHLYVGEARLQ
jgi:integrase